MENSYLKILHLLDVVIEKLRSLAANSDELVAEKDRELNKVRIDLSLIDEDVMAQKQIVESIKNADIIRKKVKSNIRKVGLPIIGGISLVGAIFLVTSSNPLAVIGITMCLNAVCCLVIEGYKAQETSYLDVLERLYSFESASRELELLEKTRDNLVSKYEITSKERAKEYRIGVNARKEIPYFQEQIDGVVNRMNFVNEITNGDVLETNKAFLKDNESQQILRRAKTVADEFNIGKEE